MGNVQELTPVTQWGGHVPSRGDDLVHTVVKAVLFVFYKLHDVFCSRGDPIAVLQGKVTKIGSFIGDMEMRQFSILAKDHPIVGWNLEGIGHQAAGDATQFSWPSDVFKKEPSQRVELMPWVIPGDHERWPPRFSHVALIIVDRAQKEVIYYDPQGLTSDDTTKAGVYGRDENGNDRTLHEDLVTTARNLFGDEGKVVEKRLKHQLDPFNCGRYVLNAMCHITDGKSMEEALRDNARPVKEIARDLGLRADDVTKRLEEEYR